MPIGSLPTNYDPCTIIGRFTYSDGTPMAGVKFTLTPSPGFMKDFTASGGAVTIVGVSQTVTLGSDGSIRGKDGSDPTAGLQIAASDDPDITPVGFTYKFAFVDPVLQRAIPAYDFSAPYGQTVDLTTVAPVPASNGQFVTKGDPGIIILAADESVPPDNTPVGSIVAQYV